MGIESSPSGAEEIDVRAELETFARELGFSRDDNGSFVMKDGDRFYRLTEEQMVAKKKREERIQISASKEVDEKDVFQL